MRPGAEDWLRFHRMWRDAGGGEWSARVDRFAMRCGACDLTRYLHVFTPAGERWTFTLAPDADLDGVADVALQRMVEERTMLSQEGRPPSESGRIPNPVADT